MKYARSTTIARVCALALVLLTSAAQAVTMEYSFSGVGSGSLDGAAFAARAFTIVGRADPARIDNCPLGCRFLDFTSAEVNIAGLGSFALLSPTRVFNNHGNLGFSRGGADGLDLYTAFLVPELYDFASPLGPVNGFVSLLQWRGVAVDDVLTSGGVLVFNDGDSDGVFRVQGVPLPGAGLMLGSALLLLHRRRRA